MQQGGRWPDNPAEVVKCVKEYDKLLTEFHSLGIGSMLLDRLPALRYLPWCPPWRTLKETLAKKEEICRKIIHPVLVRHKKEHN